MLKLSALNNDQINYANIGLMIFSAILAFVLPFELFLFSYAILGPLHYLTEIGWLHKKNYFTKGKYDFVFLSVLCALVFYFSFIQPAKNDSQIPNIILFGLLLSLIFVLIKDNLYRIVLSLLALIGIAMASTGMMYFVWVGVFLPTIIHVFVFTWAFMLYGVIKNKSFSGYLSVAALGLIAMSFFLIKAPGLQYQVSSYVTKSYDLFYLLNTFLIDFFGLSTNSKDSATIVYNTNAGFIIMRFIAFSYTYHYLNWFSKTSIIQWHKVPKRTLLITLSIWIFSMALYVVDYNIGLKALYFLSFLHVFLEFPLNITSFQGIFRAILPVKK
ncbi:MAG: hypothetical protein H7141_01645 [Burkholderiales bacterium]|nr:hypothetical protein [Bacteroidia bacterium]